MSLMPRVTIFTPAYNAAAHIAESIESSLAQTWPDFELLIIDDGSTDETATILERYADDDRVRVIFNRRNQGQPRVRNQAFAEARGEYLALIDADDYSEPERIARQVAYMDAYREVDVLACGWRFGGEGPHRPRSARGHYRLEYTPEALRAEMLFHCPVHQSTLMLRAARVDGFRYDPDFIVCQDHELWSRMIGARRFAMLPESLVVYRQHASQITETSGRGTYTARMAIQRRQLEALGLAPSTTDLFNHNLLFEFRGRGQYVEQAGQLLDADFLRWAGQWIVRLLDANERHGLYPQPELAEILAVRWDRLLRKSFAAPGLRWAALQEITRRGPRHRLHRARRVARARS